MYIIIYIYILIYTRHLQAGFQGRPRSCAAGGYGDSLKFGEAGFRAASVDGSIFKLLQPRLCEIIPAWIFEVLFGHSRGIQLLYAWSLPTTNH